MDKCWPLETLERACKLGDFWGQFNKTVTSVAIVLEAENK